MVKVYFVSQSKEIEVSRGAEFIELVEKYPNAPLRFGCRRGGCGVCAIAVRAGIENLSKPSKEEKELLSRKGLEGDCRLACQCAINGDVEIDSIALMTISE